MRPTAQKGSPRFRGPGPSTASQPHQEKPYLASKAPHIPAPPASPTSLSLDSSPWVLQPDWAPPSPRGCLPCIWWQSQERRMGMNRPPEPLCFKTYL